MRSCVGTLSSLPHLRKPPREVGADPSLVTMKVVGSMENGGNLFWGRQLRPELCSQALKKEIVLLQPCLAAASSSVEGNDSGRWGPFHPFWLNELGHVTILTNVIQFFHFIIIIITEKQRLLRLGFSRSIRLWWQDSSSSRGTSHDSVLCLLYTFPKLNF